MLNLKVWSVSLGLTGAVSFVACVAWGLATPQSVHMHPLLEMILPGFHWLSVGSFFLGLVESFLWGVWGAVVFVPIHNRMHQLWGNGLKGH